MLSLFLACGPVHWGRKENPAAASQKLLKSQETSTVLGSESSRTAQKYHGLSLLASLPCFAFQLFRAPEAALLHHVSLVKVSGAAEPSSQATPVDLAMHAARAGR